MAAEAGFLLSPDDSRRACDASISVLTLNAGRFLERQLRAVMEQETERAVEMLLVDSGSTDDTLAIAARYSFVRVVSISVRPFDFGRARDAAFDHARGAFIVSLSQDAIPARRDWIERLLEPFVKPEVAASCGRSIPDPERGFPQFPWEANGRFYFTREIKKFASRYGRGLSNANSAIRRRVWEELRFGPQSIGEDFRFQMKLRDAGLRIAFPDAAPVYHHHDYTFRALVTRCHNEGLGLREMGCSYALADLARDLLGPRMIGVWLRECLRGRLTSLAALTFPVVRPVSVYWGSRFGRSLAP